MALIAAEALELTLPKLKTRIIATALKRGPALITARLPCKFDPADELKVLFESTGDVGSSLTDPFPADTAGWNAACTSNNTSRTSDPLFLGWKQMSRNADVHFAHTFDKRFFDRQSVEINKQYQYILQEWSSYVINGLGHNSLAFNGAEYWLNFISTNYRPEVVIYGTDDGLATGVSQPFSLPMIRKLITSVVCSEYDAIVTDLTTFNSLMTLLEAAGGNTATMLMATNFGVPVMSNGQYAGVPIIISDDVGADKKYAFTINVGTLTTVEVDPTDKQFIGFNSLDVGRDFSATGFTFGGGNATTTIASIVDAYTVTLTDPADAAGSGTFLVAATQAMYAIRFSEDDGFHFRHPTENGTSPEGAYPCLPSVCGLQEINLGILQACPGVVRNFISARGNFQTDSAYAVARLSGFDVL